MAGSKQKGLARKVKLDAFEVGNIWVKAFYAKHTFEVDFITEGNEWEVKKIIKQVYVDQDTRGIAKADIEGADVSIYGKRVLTMAKQEGKGWFAIMLGKHISYKTILPSYIIGAIFFAKEMSPNIIADIIDYRIKKNLEDNNTLDFTSCKVELLKYRNGEITLGDLAFDFDLVIPDDQILTLIDKLK